MKRHFDVAICTAKDIEGAALQLAFLDLLTPLPGYPRPYQHCRLSTRHGSCDIVAACATRTGAVDAGQVVNDVARDFQVDYVILAGIAAGVPQEKKPADHVRLGDVVAAADVVLFGGGTYASGGLHGGLTYANPPCDMLRDYARSLRQDFLATKAQPWTVHIGQGVKRNPGFGMPSHAKCPDVFLTGGGRLGVHPKQPERIPGRPLPHLGVTMSFPCVLKDAVTRDWLARDYRLRAIEMEAEGVARAAAACGVHYAVIKGICDYADGRKRDDWQPYAALVSAAFIRALLEVVPWGPRPASGKPAAPTDPDGPASLTLMVKMPLSAFDEKKGQFERDLAQALGCKRGQVTATATEGTVVNLTLAGPEAYNRFVAGLHDGPVRSFLEQWQATVLP